MRINEQPGYEVVFRARNDDGAGALRALRDAASRSPTRRRRSGAGVTLELLGTPAAGIPNAGVDRRRRAQLKLPLRSFRFGTEAP